MYVAKMKLNYAVFDADQPLSQIEKLITGQLFLVGIFRPKNNLLEKGNKQ